MSIKKSKGNNLPPLQKRIVLHLAENGAQTINETVKGLKGHYKSSWIAFNSLEEKGLIKKTDLKIYRNREYSRFWLTQGGVFVALVEGANATNLLQRTLKSYPNDKTLQCCLELSHLLGLEGFKIALSAIRDKGKLDYSDMMKILFAHAQKEVSVEQFRKLGEILKRYPKEYYRTKKNVSQIIKVLTKLESLI
jgi:hypothetical protein